MAYEYKFPDIGEGITEGEILEWNVKEGDVVKEHDVLGKIETDKAVAEIPSPVSGTVLKIHFKPGDTVKVGETMVTIGERGEKVPQAVSQPAARQVAQSTVQQAATKEKQPVFKPAGVVGYLEEAPEVEVESEVEKEVASVKKLQKELKRETKVKEAAKEFPAVLATPATRKVARELGVDLAEVKGTGLGGRITEEDVRRVAKQMTKKIEEVVEENVEESVEEAYVVSDKVEKEEMREAQPEVELGVQKKYDIWGYVERVPLKGVRKAIARKVSESARHAAHVTAFDEADVTKLWMLREREKTRAELEGVKLTFLPFIIKACVHALRDHPFVNSSLDEEHDEIILKKYYNVGIAIDTEDGLIVPVVKGADQKSIKTIAKEIQELAEKTRKRKIDLGDLKGGTFTITNYGSIRGTWATPIINYPEAAILGVGRIFDKLVVEGEKAYKRKILPLSLSFDHRIFDGADAAKFMQTLIEHLEDPDLLLVED